MKLSLEHFLNNITKTENGYCYKNENIFNKEHDSICYVPECGIDYITEMCSKGVTYVEKDFLIQKCAASTRNTILQEVFVYLSRDCELSKEQVFEFIKKTQKAELIFQELSWQCSSTLVYDLDESFFEEMCDFYCISE